MGGPAGEEGTPSGCPEAERQDRCLETGPQRLELLRAAGKLSAAFGLALIAQKTPAILSAMGLELEKTDAARDEIRRKLGPDAAS